MELRKNSWYAWIYKHSYTNYVLPHNLCPFFWKLFFAILLFPITWICIVLDIIYGDKRSGDPLPFFGKCVLGIIILVLSTIIGMRILGLEKGHLDWYAPFVGLIGLISIIYILYLIVTFIGRLHTFIEKRSPKRDFTKPKRTTIVVEFMKAKIGKYCPKITWK
jgi:hypothetical protein